jgi:hypothetical protein
MTDEHSDGVTIIVAASTIGLTITYPDGSRIQLAMPKPAGLEIQTSEQVETLARRMARRLLGVAMEDLGGG